MKKIAIIAPGILPIPAIKGGAIETLITNLIMENEKHNSFDLTVFSYYNRDAKRVSEQFKYCKIHYINCFSFYANIYNLICRIIRKFTLNRINIKDYFMSKISNELINNIYDSIIVEGQISYITSLSKKIENELILHLHTDILNIDTRNAYAILNRCNKVIVVSEFLKKRILEINHSYSRKVSVLKNSIDTYLFNSSKKVDYRKDIRNRYKISPEEKVVIFCGRLHPGKGLNELILAFTKLKAKCKLFVVGSVWFSSNKYNNYVKQIKNIVNNNKNIIFTGYVPQKELPQYYAASDISIVPSICNEAAGLVIIEAMAMGLPLVASNIGGIPEYTNPDCCIFLDTSEHFIDQIINALEILINDTNKYNEMVSSCTRNIEEYSTDKYYHHFVNIV